MDGTFRAMPFCKIGAFANVAAGPGCDQSGDLANACLAFTLPSNNRASHGARQRGEAHALGV